jgi:hypothetical protein
VKPEGKLILQRREETARGQKRKAHDLVTAKTLAQSVRKVGM